MHEALVSRMPRVSRKVNAILIAAAILIGIGLVILSLALSGVEGTTPPPADEDALQGPEAVHTAPASSSTLSQATATTTPALGRATIVGTPRATPTAQTREAVATSTPSATPSPVVSGTPRSATPLPVSTLLPGTPTLPVGGPGAATNLQSEATCSLEDPAKGVSRLSWAPAAKRGAEQRVALTTYVRGFDTGIFVTTEPLPPDRQSFVWERTGPGIIHYWWVLTLHTEGWVPSEVASFEGADCVADYAQTPSP